MRPEYLHKGKRRLINPDGLEERLNAFVAWVLVHNAHFVRQSSRLVLPDVLPFRNKVCEFLHWSGEITCSSPAFWPRIRRLSMSKIPTTYVFGKQSPRHAPTSLITQADRANTTISSNPRNGIRCNIRSWSPTSPPLRTSWGLGPTYTRSSTMKGRGSTHSIAKEGVWGDGRLAIQGWALGLDKKLAALHDRVLM